MRRLFTRLQNFLLVMVVVALIKPFRVYHLHSLSILTNAVHVIICLCELCLQYVCDFFVFTVVFLLFIRRSEEKATATKAYREEKLRILAEGQK
jgi:nicotinamide riboside transporter PnuC